MNLEGVTWKGIVLKIEKPAYYGPNDMNLLEWVMLACQRLAEQQNCCSPMYRAKLLLDGVDATYPGYEVPSTFKQATLYFGANDEKANAKLIDTFVFDPKHTAVIEAEMQYDADLYAGTTGDEKWLYVAPYDGDPFDAMLLVWED